MVRWITLKCQGKQFNLRHQPMRSMKNIQKNTGIALFFILSILAAIVVTRLIPPIQSPDENVHLMRADMISHGQWLLQPGSASKGREGGLVDSNFVVFAESMMGISGNGAPKEKSPALLTELGQKKWAHQEQFANAAGTGYYLPIIYAPHALGLFVARKLDLTMGASYEVIRVLVVATSIILLGWAFSLYTPNLLSLMLLATPMALFQLNSPTIDGLCMAMAVLAIGLWFHISTSRQYLDDGKFSWHEAFLYGLIIVLCTARTNLLPTLLIPLTLTVSRPTKERMFSIAGMYVLTAGWIVFGVSTTYDSRVVREHTTSTVLFNYLSHPIEFFELIQRTVSDSEIRKFYRHSYFGILGWLDTPISRAAVRIFSAFTVIAAVILIVTTPWRNDWKKRVLLLLIGISSTILIFFALAVSWSNYPTDKITGIQGRYFLIPTLFMAAALGRAEAGGRISKPIEAIALVVFLTYSFFILITTLANQYRLGSLYF